MKYELELIKSLFSYIHWDDDDLRWSLTGSSLESMSDLLHEMKELVEGEERSAYLQMDQ